MHDQPGGQGQADQPVLCKPTSTECHPNVLAMTDLLPPTSLTSSVVVAVHVAVVVLVLVVVVVVVVVIFNRRGRLKSAVAPPPARRQRDALLGCVADAKPKANSGVASVVAERRALE